MYHYPPNSIEFKKGYALGIEKGRKIERRLSLALVIGFVLVFELAHWLLGLYQKCG
jgi:uncharacterized protein YebE (UPF0316 family)